MAEPVKLSCIMDLLLVADEVLKRDDAASAAIPKSPRHTGRK